MADVFASTPEPPYYSVIFTSQRAADDGEAYEAAAIRMLELATDQDGYLGVETVRDSDGAGITVSYWRDAEAIRRWHEVAEHKETQVLGRSQWYKQFKVRVCRVEREYGS